MQSLAWKTVVIALVVFTAAFLIPWHNVNWGKIEMVQPNVVTVTGEAESQQANQLATFTAGATATNLDKNSAVAQANQKVTSLTQAVKDFGIAAADIKTQNLSVYQIPKNYGNQNAGQWQVSNDISITLRDITKASALTDLLTNSGATNVNGPNFTTTDTQSTQVGLLDKAIQNAREKAQAIATAGGRQLGQVVSVTEGATSTNPVPFMRALGGAAGAPVEPGSQTVSQSVTVTFELK